MHASRRALDARRQHWQHGPIDLVIEAWGDAAALARAYTAAWSRFEQVLPELVSELALLRTPVAAGVPGDVTAALRGPVAQRMLAACQPHAAQFITPMAAVAGAVADEIGAFFATEPGVRKAYVNNGGDIALHLRQGESLTIGIIAHPQPSLQTGDVTITSAMSARGIATSGWRGRSFSLGIADSVTVLAANAAAADAAATMIANAVNLDHPAIGRAPANTRKDDTDLGARLVTVQVPPLARGQVLQALEAGMVAARACQRRGLIDSALLLLQGEAMQLENAEGAENAENAEGAEGAPSLRPALKLAA